MKFKKYVAEGNDFIIFKGEEVAGENLEELAKNVCSRHYGIGADGILIYEKSEGEDLTMTYYDSNGKEDVFPGSGLIAFAKYLYDNSLLEEGELIIDTGSGERRLDLISGEEGRVRIGMGQPILKSKNIPIAMDLDRVIGESIDVAGYDYIFSSMNIDGPESMIFFQKINDAQINYLGDQVANHKIFPEKSNVNFVIRVDRDEINVYSWDREKGRVLTNINGACAAVVAGNLMESLDERVRVNLEGGSIEVEYKNNKLSIEGNSKFIAQGKYNNK